MKVGQLVMKIAIGKTDKRHQMVIPVGTIGEVKPNWPSEDMFKDHVIVFFPSFPSWDHTQCWQAHKDLLIALNDPDMDVTENEEETLEDFV